MIMKGEQCAREVVKFFRSQPQRDRSVKLLGIKVQLKQFYRNAYTTSKYIETNYSQYTAHAKDDSFDKLSISYKKLEPIDDCVSSNLEVCEMVIALWETQKKKEWEMELISIKVMLPEWVDSEKISEYIQDKFPNYKVHPKNQGKYPIVAIGNA